MIETSDIKRPSKELIQGLALIGSATASGVLSKLGIRDSHIQGLVAWNHSNAIAGPALTLQFMPKREDLYGQMSTKIRKASFIVTHSNILSLATS